MEKIYCGGVFHFDYRNEDYLQSAKDDYRAILLGDIQKMLFECKTISLSDHLAYVGPFYFESDGMEDTDIVIREKEQIEASTHTIFLLEDACCPGTITEMVYAAMLQKRMSIFYVKNEEETESRFRSACWYPICMCLELNRAHVEVVSCETHSEATEKILKHVKESILSL